LTKSKSQANNAQLAIDNYQNMQINEINEEGSHDEFFQKSPNQPIPSLPLPISSNQKNKSKKSAGLFYTLKQLNDASSFDKLFVNDEKTNEPQNEYSNNVIDIIRSESSTKRLDYLW